jgi:protein TonB
MSAIASQDFETSPAATAAARTTPIWLRPTAIFFAVAVHAAVFLAFVVTQEAPITPLDAVEVAIVQQGALETEIAAAPISDQVPDDLLAVEQTPPSPPIAPPPMEQPTASLALKEVADAEVLPDALPESPPLTSREPPPAEPVQQKQKVEIAPSKTKPLEKKPDRKKLAKHGAPPSVEHAPVARTGASTAQRAGVADGQASQSGQTRASYGALVLAELHRHQFYPNAARAEGVTGSVGVVFTVGSSGQIVSHSITRSSGNNTLDAAARQMMQAVHVPPPPGGSFSGSTSIRFNIGQ